MVATRAVAICSTIVCLGILADLPAAAADIEGAWASDKAVCHKLYSKAAGSVSFARDSYFHGSGFIIEKTRIRGRVTSCSIMLRKERDTRVDLIATCSTDIAVDTLQFSLRIEGPGKLIREFPGVPEMAVSYERCSL